jgi:serine/threonine protein kinase
MTGRVPFDGKNYNAVLYAIVANEAPALPSLGAGDEALWAVLQKGLSKNPDDRFGSIFELGRELASWLISQDVFNDITGASLQAGWLDTRNSPSIDPLASLAPPPMNEGRLSVDLKRIPTAILERASYSELKKEPKLLWAALGALVVGMLGAVLLAGGSSDDVAANPVLAAPAVAEPVPELVEPDEPFSAPTLNGQRAAVPQNTEPVREQRSESVENKKLDTEPQGPDPAASSESTLKKSQWRSPKTRKSELKNPFE